jgi:DNA-binding response OmpR family regulator
VASILIIEDEEACRDSLRCLLETRGYDVSCAPEGRRGMEVFRAERQDIVLTDIMMPGQEGIETIMELRSMVPDCPIVAMSGGGSIGGDDFLKMAARLGADVTLPKPFTADDLFHAIDTAMARHDRPEADGIDCLQSFRAMIDRSAHTGAELRWRDPPE